tara:strand:- start:4531 stop:5295 length:765 start_codon:yes stop_codon:yes gene_type:complete
MFGIIVIFLKILIFLVLVMMITNHITYGSNTSRIMSDKHMLIKTHMSDLSTKHVTNISRKAVVHHFKHKPPFNWIPIEYEFVQHYPDIRIIAESREWLHWIVTNYNELPDYVIFLHGHPKSWHVKNTKRFKESIASATPKEVLMLGTPMEDVRGSEVPRWAHFNPHYPGWNGYIERSGLDWVNGELFNMTFLEAWKKWDWSDHKCCSEMVVSKSALLQIPLQTYKNIETHINQTPGEPWGWIMERTWQNMFSHF